MTKNYYITILFTAIPMTPLMVSCKFGPAVGITLGLVSVVGYIMAGFFLGRRWDEKL